MADPYYQAARFQSKQKAGVVYFPLQQYIYEVKDDCDLSVYRFKDKHKNTWYVVVIGERPPERIHVVIEAKLTNGVLVSLGQDVLAYLQDRRARAIQFGPWVEAHYDNAEEE